MRNKSTDIIHSFIQLMVYTLEFRKNNQSEVYTIDKLVQDYETLINRARDDFEKSMVVMVTFEEALFPFVAWIDEVILSSEYKEKKQWRKNLLQKKFYSTSNAGYEFYERLSNIEKHNYTLRLLYLYSLFLGFRGKYYKNEDKYLLEDIFLQEKALVGDSFSEQLPQHLFKSAYNQKELSKRVDFNTSYKKVWILISVSLVLGLVLYLAQQAHLNGLLEKYNIF